MTLCLQQALWLRCKIEDLHVFTAHAILLTWSELHVPFKSLALLDHCYASSHIHYATLLISLSQNCSHSRLATWADCIWRLHFQVVSVGRVMRGRAGGAEKPLLQLPMHQAMLCLVCISSSTPCLPGSSSDSSLTLGWPRKSAFC